MKKKHILIVAGGTGGHISPGIALAEEFNKKQIDTVFLSLFRNEKSPDLKNTAFPVEFYNAPSLSGPLLHKMLFPVKLTVAIFRAFAIFVKYNVNSVVCMGGYSTIPAVVAAIVRRLPVYLCEQNAMPGKVTYLFGRFAEKIFLNFPDSSGRLESYQSKCFMTGNPVRKTILDLAEKKKNVSKKMSGELSVLVLGGSQGALQINKMAAAAIPALAQMRWTVQCGEKNIESMKQLLLEKNITDVDLFGFSTNIHEYYNNADVLVCRAGAGVLSEGCLFGLPMILIPYPYAADNHQRENALYLEKKGAAFVIDTKDTEPDDLISMLNRLRQNKNLRSEMSRAALECGMNEASEKITETILSDLKK